MHVHVGAARLAGAVPRELQLGRGVGEDGLLDLEALPDRADVVETLSAVPLADVRVQADEVLVVPVSAVAAKPQLLGIEEEGQLGPSALQEIALSNGLARRLLWGSVVVAHLELGIPSEARGILGYVAAVRGHLGAHAAKPVVPGRAEGGDQELQQEVPVGEHPAEAGGGPRKVDVLRHEEDALEHLEGQSILERRRFPSFLPWPLPGRRSVLDLPSRLRLLRARARLGLAGPTPLASDVDGRQLHGTNLLHRDGVVVQT